MIDRQIDRDVVSPLCPWVPHLRIQTTADQKYSGEKRRNFRKAELEFAERWQLFT